MAWGGAMDQTGDYEHFLEACHMFIIMKAEPLEPAAAFPYLGHTVTYNNNDWAALYQNFRKVRRRWGAVANMVTNMVAMVRAQGMLYKLSVQMVLIYGSKIWVLSGGVLKVL